MARRAHVFVLAALLLAAGAHAQSPGDPGTPLTAPITNDLILSPTTTTSGLNLVPSSNGTGAFAGRTLSDSGATGITAMLNNLTDAAGWKDTFT